MRRLLVLALLALLLGVAVVALVETSPGYILVSYGAYTLETSVWVGLFLLVLFTAVLYGGIALLHTLLASRKSLRGWFGGRKIRQSAQLTNNGLINFIEGNWARARQQLLRGADHSEAPLLNYLMAARASFQLGEPERMREYLSAAERADAGAEIAVDLTQAELKLKGLQFEQAVATLERARSNVGKHPYVLKLLSKAYLGLSDWPQLLLLLPELRKHQVIPETELLELERTVHTRLLHASVEPGGDGSTRERLHHYWQSVPAARRRDPELLHTYTGLLIRESDHEGAANVIRKALKQGWDSDLVRLFGYVELPDPGRQLAQAEAWLAEHPQDPQLLLCLGRLACRHKLWGKAREYFENSNKQRRSPEACAELGRLLAALGEENASAAAFREGLLLREKSLPRLPLPEPGIRRAR